MLAPTVSLAQLPRARQATVASVAWDMLTAGEARRLREFGLDEGVEVELLHRAMLGGGPLACRIGRMTVGVRAHVARAILVAPAAG